MLSIDRNVKRVYKPILKSIYPSPPETTSILSEADSSGLPVESGDFEGVTDVTSMFAPLMQNKISYRKLVVHTK